jgi:hypothetical protein
MKKRIFIGAIAVVVIGVGAYVLSQRKEGTVEWHKEQWVKANTKTPVTQLMKLGRLSGKTTSRRVRNGDSDVVPRRRAGKCKVQNKKYKVKLIHELRFSGNRFRNWMQG